MADLTRKILLVDDEKNMVALLRFELEQLHYQVSHAYNGEEGFQRYLEEKPHLIILDLHLPHLHGYEVCRRIRREKKDAHTPILILTARKEEMSGEVERIIGRVIGIQRYMTKPFEIEELLNQIDDLMNSRQT